MLLMRQSRRLNIVGRAANFPTRDVHVAYHKLDRQSTISTTRRDRHNQAKKKKEKLTKISKKREKTRRKTNNGLKREKNVEVSFYNPEPIIARGDRPTRGNIHKQASSKSPESPKSSKHCSRPKIKSAARYLFSIRNTQYNQPQPRRVIKEFRGVTATTRLFGYGRNAAGYKINSLQQEGRVVHTANNHP